MDTTPARQRAWAWASEWFNTLSFWLVAAVSAVAGLFLAYALTKDWGAAGAWAVVGAPAGVLLVLLGRWGATPWLDAAELGVQLAEELRAAREDAKARLAPVGDTRDLGWDERNDLILAFGNYADRQIEALEKVIIGVEKGFDLFGWTEQDWDDFTSLARRTIDGIMTFDDVLGEYVASPLRDADFKRDRGAEDMDLLFLAKRVITAIEETKGLYRP